MCTEARWIVLVLLFTSCLNPDDILPIRGRVEGADQLVVFSRAPSTGPGACGEWTELERAVSDSDGGYAFEVFRAQAIKFTTGQTFCFRVDTGFFSGTSASATMFVLNGEAQVPLLADWNPAPYLDGQELRFTPYRQAPDGGTFYLRHIVRMHDGLREVWHDADAQWNERGFVEVPMDLHDRIVREFGAFVSLSASYVESEKLENPLLELVVLPRVEAKPFDQWYFGTGVVPLSRGAECDFLPSPCGLTDGQLFTDSLRQLPWIQVNFRQPVKPSLVVVRALIVHSNVVKISGVLPNQETVELATHRVSRELDDDPVPLRDGGAEPAPNFFSVRLDAGVEFRALRIEAEGLVSAQEVSVF